MLQEIWQQRPGRHWDLPFSHPWQAFPSHKAAVVRLGSETAPQSTCFLGCAGQVCVPLPYVHSSAQLFPVTHKPRQIAAQEISGLMSLVSRQMLCGEYHRALRSPPAVSQDWIFEVTRRYRMVLGNLIPNTTHCCFIGVQFLAMGLFLFGFLLVFWPYKVPPDATCLCVPTVTLCQGFLMLNTSQALPCFWFVPTCLACHLISGLTCQCSAFLQPQSHSLVLHDSSSL